MQPSMFNVQVPVPARDEVFLMNTFSDAQLLVSTDVASLMARAEAEPSTGWSGEEREALATLADNGFLVPDRAHERAKLDQFFRDVREDTSQLRITVLTTLQCNFACDYCIQGDHGDYNKNATKMSLERAAELVEWVESRLDAVKPSRFVLTLFGGEPLLNLPVCYFLAEELWTVTQARGVEMLVNVITNGLLLTEEVVDRLTPYGLNGIKVTLDGDRDAHNLSRPLRGGQGTFDKIIANVRKVSPKVRISIGGNFDAASVDSYPALLDFLAEQEFAPRISKVAFKPVIKPSAPAKTIIPLMAVGDSGKPLGGACMTAAGSGIGSGKASSVCDNCHFVDDQMIHLMEETEKRGFPTMDGVHMGPCEIHKKNAHTIGPEGALYACPGFAGEKQQSVGNIYGTRDVIQAATAEKYDGLAAWKACGDCAFIPVCAGGCTTAAHAEFNDIQKPNCHIGLFEAGVKALAMKAAAGAA
ncbi:MAG: radical SAM protein [Acidobacteriota bacterium]|nr:radical SAM protein [Acidobacteriota bacterium]